MGGLLCTRRKPLPPEELPSPLNYPQVTPNQPLSSEEDVSPSTSQRSPDHDSIVSPVPVTDNQQDAGPSCTDDTNNGDTCVASNIASSSFSSISAASPTPYPALSPWPKDSESEDDSLAKRKEPWWKRKNVLIGLTLLILLVLVAVAVGCYFLFGSWKSLDGQSGSGSTWRDVPCDRLIQDNSSDRCLKPMVILVSLGGFRARYMDLNLTPNLERLRLCGASVDNMRPSYPTLTFPNHYTIVTGLYPESHGIIANKFTDPDTKESFDYTKPESTEGYWWGGEPIWNTLQRQNKTAYTFFWPGSQADIGGMRPGKWFPYNESVPFSQRVETVLEWVDLPMVTRPDFIALYLNEPDHEARNYGPDSPQVNDILNSVDAEIGKLLQGLYQRDMLGCVDVIIVGDHGNTPVNCERLLFMDTYVTNPNEKGDFYSGIYPTYNYTGDDTDVVEAVTCKNDALRAYMKKDLPPRLHGVNNRRIPGLVFDLDQGYRMNQNSWDPFCLKGDNGYDNHHLDMQALFITHGPHIVPGKYQDFQNIELYNLMAEILEVEPAPNNGTWMALSHMVKSNTTQPLPPVPPIVRTVDGEFPSSAFEYDKARQQLCGDWNYSVSLDLSLNLANDERIILEKRHLPWGEPLVMTPGLNSDITKLTQADYVAGYSADLRMPLWTAYSVTSANRNVIEDHLWRPDVRISPNISSCVNWYNSSSLTAYPAFPTILASVQSDTKVITNALPVDDYLGNDLLVYLWAFIYRIFKRKKYVHVVSGPIFDFNSDGLVDDLTDIINRAQNASLTKPSHLFYILTFCSAFDESLSRCEVSSLQSLTFVLPNKESYNCWPGNKTPQELIYYSARVRDVELLTGFRFFANLTQENYLPLSVALPPLEGADVWTLLSG